MLPPLRRRGLSRGDEPSDVLRLEHQDHDEDHRLLPERPITVVRFGSSRSGASSAKGSTSADAASSNETPCFATPA